MTTRESGVRRISSVSRSKGAEITCKVGGGTTGGLHRPSLFWIRVKAGEWTHPHTHHSHPHTHTHKNSHAHTHTAHTLTHSQTHTHALTCSHTCTHAHSHTLTHTYNVHTHTHTHTMYTHTHTLHTIVRCILRGVARQRLLIRLHL